MTRWARLAAEGAAIVAVAVAAGALVGSTSGWFMQAGVRRALFVVGGIGLFVWWLARHPAVARRPVWPRRTPDEMGPAPDRRTRELEALIRRRREQPARLAETLRAIDSTAGADAPRDLPALARWLDERDGRG
ncbi:MAG: hypothetical protein Q4F65_02560 [Propionibacteriaceae bacterium]|nr:hypothetical protein [Propionibacteriaceae bacterium]